MTLTRENRQALLAKIDQLVTTKYYDPSFGGNDWTAIVSCYQDEILGAKTDESFEKSVLTMLGQLVSAELGLLSPSTKIQPRSSINASVRSVMKDSDGPQWVFQDVLPGGVAARADIRPGDSLVSIAGVATRPPQPPAFPMNERVPITIYRAGMRHELELKLSIQKPKYKSNPYSEPSSVTATLRGKDVGIMKVDLFPGFLGVDFANEVSRHFARTFASIKRLLIDLRGNPGGGIGGLRIMSHLTPSRLPIGYSIDRPTAAQVTKRSNSPGSITSRDSNGSCHSLPSAFTTRNQLSSRPRAWGVNPFTDEWSSCAMSTQPERPKCLLNSLRRIILQQSWALAHADT